jgi:hypothetical protein
MSIISALALMLLLYALPTWANPKLNVLKSNASGLLVELHISPPDLRNDAQALAAIPGLVRLDSTQLPFLSRLIAAPPGAKIELHVREVDYVETDMGEVDAMPILSLLPRAPERATSRYIGSLRGVEAHALHLYPYDYDASRHVLRTYTRLRVEVRFVGGRSAKNTLQQKSHASYAAFLNGKEALLFYSQPPAAKIQAETWYDPASDWVKVHVNEDGIHRIGRAWLARFADIESIDPQTLRLFYLGQEQALHVHGSEDGHFDEGDYLLFHGTYRRDDRDFESLYGRRNTYWLTWGGQAGLRFAERDAKPTNGYPLSRSFWTTVHFERDLIFNALSEAPNAERDHWFWTLNNKPLTATRPDVPSAAEFPGDLLFPDLDREEYTANVRVALHGASDLGHHTVLKLNGSQVLDERIWGEKRAGMIEFLAQAEVASDQLKNGRNRILLQVFADQEKFDLMWFNWFEIDYFRRYSANGGYLDATHLPSNGHRIEVENLAHPHVEIFELNGSTRLTGSTINGSDSLYTATFEDLIEQEARYVVADSLAFKTPVGVDDISSDWRNFTGAEYLVIAHPLLMAQAEKISIHRKNDGLRTAAISSQDLYDEFNYGLFDAEAIRTFIDHAYHHWSTPPTYVVLLGDDTWDYRNIIGGGRPTIVPSLYYQSRGRGLAPSDFLYSLVDGDDLLADLSIGRLATSSQDEAEVVINKIIDYDTAPEPGPWRSRMLFVANHHPKDLFTKPSDSLAVRYAEPAGLAPIKVYNPDEGPIPNPTGRAFVDALNEGALLLNFNGHGSPGTMQSLFTLSLPDWGYLGQVQNGRRLPLVLALSCLNGLFSNPTVEGLAETFTNRREGGAIAYISASAKSFVAQNDLLSDRLYAGLFAPAGQAFGPALDAAKTQVLAVHSSWVDAALTMQLIGDPAQRLGLAAVPDYAALSFAVAADAVRGHGTAPLDATLANYGRLGADSLHIEILAYGEAGAVDTLLSIVEPPFVGQRALSFDWPVGARRGPYRLELRLDGGDALVELDESNNLLDIAIDILEPLLAVPVFPAQAAALASAELVLEAAVPIDGSAYFCQFAFATTADFAAAELSPLVETKNGLAIYRPTIAAKSTYFWRVRLHSGIAAGPWSTTRSFYSAPGPRWSQRLLQLLAATTGDFELRDDALALSSQPSPLRPDSTRREDGFTVRDHLGSGVVVTDGTWLYAKRWYNDASTTYPGSDYFTRIGTGLNDTFRSGNFGAFGDSTSAGISATYHSDGYIYNESGKAFEIERLSISSGALDTVEVPEGLLEWKFGRVENGHSLITSDGTYIYNVAMSTPQGARNAWGIRVFDPAQNWALTREFTSPATETGFTFEWTDGILADGQYLYLIEWRGQQRIRMIDAFDGSFVDEWQSDQETTRVITGQYDWINNKVWLGDLWSSAIFRYSGLRPIERGELVSEPIGAAAAWHALSVEGDDLLVDVLVADGDQWIAHPNWTSLTPGSFDLSSLSGEDHPQIRLRARLLSARAKLDHWSLDWTPRPALTLTRAEGYSSPHGLRVQATVRNFSAVAVGGATLSLQLGGENQRLHRVAVGTLARGETRVIKIDSLEMPARSERLFAELETVLLDAEPADNRRQVTLFIAGRLPLNFSLWPAGRSFFSGDPLLSGQGLLVSAADLAGGEIEVRIDGISIEPDSLIDAFPEPSRLLFRPELEPGQHQLEARLLRDDLKLGSARLLFYAGDALRISNALPYPHPVRLTAHFTYVLSLAADVEVEIFSLSGRLVRRLGPFEQQPGFAQVAWDGRDAGGALLASGTYLYRIAAASGSEQAVFRGALAVVRD